MDSKEDVINAVKAVIPTELHNQVLALLSIYHNTLIKEKETCV